MIKMLSLNNYIPNWTCLVSSRQLMLFSLRWSQNIALTTISGKKIRAIMC